MARASTSCTGKMMASMISVFHTDDQKPGSLSSSCMVFKPHAPLSLVNARRRPCSSGAMKNTTRYTTDGASRT